MAKEKFLGNWKVEGRSILEGVEFKFIKNDKGSYSGSVSKLNGNRFVQLLMDTGDIFISGLERTSSYEFELTEQKVAGPLFSTYGQSSSSTLKATFKNKDTILLGNNGSKGKYVRIKH